MLETFRKLWKIKDLQKKVLYTFLMLLIYRLVGVIPAPGIDVSRLNESNNFMQLPLLNMMQMMTGNAFGQMTIMAMGITPYINASIIMQLLAVAFPSLQRMQEEEGDQKEDRHDHPFRYGWSGSVAVPGILLLPACQWLSAERCQRRSILRL